MTRPLSYQCSYIPPTADTETHDGRSTWDIHNHNGDVIIGRVIWYLRERNWVVQLANESVWSTGCLADEEAEATETEK